LYGKNGRAGRIGKAGRIERAGKAGRIERAGKAGSFGDPSVMVKGRCILPIAN